MAAFVPSVGSLGRSVAAGSSSCYTCSDSNMQIGIKALANPILTSRIAATDSAPSPYKQLSSSTSRTSSVSRALFGSMPISHVAGDGRSRFLKVVARAGGSSPPPGVGRPRPKPVRPQSPDNEDCDRLPVNKEIRCECYNLYDQCIPYMDAWTWQKALVKKKMEAIQEGQDVDDAVLLLQHNPVYTMGTRSSEEYLLFDKDQPPCNLYRTERGGEVTYHGPGQLVMYPILNLRNFRTDLHWYLRSLEEVVIRALWNACGIEATRIKGLTGVWVGTEKVAAIGVRVSRWVTYHGLALNVTTDLSPFKRIVPCGISSYSVGSVAEILRRQGHFQMQSPVCLNQTDNLLDLLHKRLLDDFSDVFGLYLSHVCHDASIFSFNFGT